MTHVREHRSILAAAEKRLLIYIAERLPRFINSDHLTSLALAGMALAGGAFAAARWDRRALWLVVVALAINWFGDSLDGTLARVRHHERPRYGFYVDHVLDVLSILFIFAGLVLGGHMRAYIGGAFLLAYYLLMIEIALATHAVGTFRISFFKFGPTELRILLAIGTLRLIESPFVSIAGSRYLLFDVGGAVAVAGLVFTFIVSAAANTRRLYRAEPLPRQARAAGSKDPALQGA